MDVLSEVLKAVKLDGAIFYTAECSAPWGFRSPPSRVMASYLSPEPKHVIVYHLVTEGRGYAHIEDDTRPVPLEAGEIVVFPHGHPHILGNGSPIVPVDSAKELQRILSEDLKIYRHGGGGELTRIICGYLACEPQLSKILLSGLPPILKVSIRNDASGEWLENSLRYSVDNSDASKPGGETVLAKLSEVLFIETLRRYIEQLPQEQAGWLAGVRDPEIGKALAFLHRQPARPWTIATLATEVGMSRSVLAERFRQYLSETPMAYLTRWRLQLGAQMLNATSRSVAEVAGEVGYESEPSFNRAFKREFGLPPARFRSQSRAVRSTSSAPATTNSRSRMTR